MVHIPVLQREVLQYLNPKANENFIDATIGQGGHTIKILDKTRPKGKVLGLEIDSEEIKDCRKRLKEFGKRVILVNDSYLNLKEIVESNNFKPADGILFDLGMSSWHLEESGRGFSFSRNEFLDMRYKVNDNLTAGDIVNKWSQEELERIFREYGQEKFAGKIAKRIIEERKRKPIKSTFELKEIIVKALPQKFRHFKIHCATRAF
jgi:16S rRNA (cytosine1402-N4)-methyltransferase